MTKETVYHLYEDTGQHYRKIASSHNMNELCSVMRQQLEWGARPERLLISQNKYVNYNRYSVLDME